MDTLKQFLSTYISEILILIGVFFIVFATFKINILAGFYVLGGILTTGGIIFAKGK